MTWAEENTEDSPGKRGRDSNKWRALHGMSKRNENLFHYLDTPISLSLASILFLGKKPT
jgi:hypothetical protein